MESTPLEKTVVQFAGLSSADCLGLLVELPGEMVFVPTDVSVDSHRA